MNNTVYKIREPLFWLVRDESKDHFRKEKITTLLAAAESLDEILREDIRDGVPPHQEDLELLKTLKHGLTLIHECE